MQEAAQLALEDFEREYEGIVCAVCQSEKWANSPFCRSCSIKLQRARMMRQFDMGQEKDWRTWPDWVLHPYWRHYDLCRLYLFDLRRHFNSARPQEEATEQHE